MDLSGAAVIDVDDRGVAQPGDLRLREGRDQAFTLLLLALDKLQPLLVEAYEGEEDLRSKLQGEFWRRLDRFSSR